VLDTDTKRRIDTARDILVGKVPDPKSQVEQITIALIYKFMDDMDAESEELGGKRKFFTDDSARYGWAKLMAPSLGGHEMLGLYGEGIAKMPENPGRRSSATSSRTPTCPTATPKRSRPFQDHRRVQLRTLRLDRSQARSQISISSISRRSKSPSHPSPPSKPSWPRSKPSKRWWLPTAN
jgi:hypothetical protein